MKVYLSSTYLDFQEYRDKVAKALRKARYEVVLMEEYVARDQLVEFACQGDVVGCDAYLGLFGWRYGWVPEDNNPQQLSVTELEYLAARNACLPCLTFLLNEKAAWPSEWRDKDQTKVVCLRTRLQKFSPAYFDDGGELGMEVLASLRVLEATKKTDRLEAIRAIHEAQAVGPSYMANLQEKLEAMQGAPFVEVQIGSTPWWNTRLHLIAALAEEFGVTREFVFVNDDRGFVAMAPPANVRKRLAERWPVLETIYAAFRRSYPNQESLGWGLWHYPEHVDTAFGTSEANGVESITRRHLEYDLGLLRDGDIVEVTGKKQVPLNREIVGRQSPFVVLVRDGKVEGLVDRVQLASKVAADALAEYN